MKNILKKLHFKRHLLIIIYLATFILILMNGLFNFTKDYFSNHEETILLVEDFTLKDFIVNEDSSITSIGPDAQMIYTSSLEINSVYYLLENPTTGVVCSYYISDNVPAFSNYHRLQPDFSISNEAFYIYPDGTTSIRLDLGSVYGEVYKFKEITLNKPIPFISYFSLTNHQIFLVIFMPIFLYSIIKYSLLIYNAYKK